MVSYPYISGAGSITQVIGFLRRTFPTTVNSDTVRRLGVAAKNESYVINVLQFLGMIDEQGKRTDAGHEAMTKHDENEFQLSFTHIVKTAYAGLFELRGDDAWTMDKNQLIAYFRTTDKTSDVVGSRQAGVFIALRELAGHMLDPNQAIPNTKSNSVAKPKSPPKKAKPAQQKTEDQVFKQDDPVRDPKAQKGDIALTVRIEINLPSGGTQETYDAIFKSIKVNLYP